MKNIEMLKTFNKEDWKYLKIPLLSLIAFVVIAFIIFPKPSKIYRKGVHKECGCLGIKASPKSTQGVGVGEEYCIGIPIKCEKTQVLKDTK